MIECFEHTGHTDVSPWIVTMVKCVAPSADLSILIELYD